MGNYCGGAYPYKLLLMGLAMLLVACQQNSVVAREKDRVGETAVITVAEAGLPYLARIDTGARVTSLHAFDLQIEDVDPDPRNNIGKTLRFSTENERGERVLMRSQISGVARVRNAQGVEYRYEVLLTMQRRGKLKPVTVNLRDRSAMTYKLLMGRNWLRGDYVVDVEYGKDAP